MVARTWGKREWGRCFPGKVEKLWRVWQVHSNVSIINATEPCIHGHFMTMHGAFMH